jgi:UDP-N-acetylmuramate: L-alanyl-gamma-D-glutamyl-meso-diaminopimelate ligase
MHSLALSMQASGHVVSGSDDEIYEPSRTRLAEKGLLPQKMGWHPERITTDIDVVVLGMHARKDNPELLKAEEIGVRISSFPEFIYNISKEKMRIVVAGSHGKTSTCGMIAHVLDASGVKADRMIGAKIGELEPVVLSDAGIIVLEGDEYLSSPLDSRPKFFHYHPQITVITGIAWDHMNVFPTYETYVLQFQLLIASLGKTDTLIYCAADPDLVDLVERIQPKCVCMPYTTHPYLMQDDQVIIHDDDGNSFPLKIFGRHNLQNLQAAQLATACIGLAKAKFYTAIQSFTGASKRLQCLYQSGRITAYQDFAHAPSKVFATVNAVREKHKDAFIIASLELHTFSSLNPDFLPLYRDALAEADARIVYYSPHTLAIKKLPELSGGQLSNYFNAPDLQVATDKERLVQLMHAIEKKDNVVLLWMSSGRFDGLDLTEISKSFA